MRKKKQTTAPTIGERRERRLAINTGKKWERKPQQPHWTTQHTINDNVAILSYKQITKEKSCNILNEHEINKIEGGRSFFFFFFKSKR